MLLTIMPGPDNIFVLTISLSQGKREGIFTSLGLAMGVLVHTIIAATGLAIIIKQSEFAFTGIKLCGAFYLFYMAYKALSEKRIEMSSESGNNSSPTLQLIQKGFLMNVLNPKVALFFIAFFATVYQPPGHECHVSNVYTRNYVCNTSVSHFQHRCIFGWQAHSLYEQSGVLEYHQMEQNYYSHRIGIIINPITQMIKK